jgi:hypothetical protein
VRVDEHTFLHLWAGSSMMPALLVWGMRRGAFDDMSQPMDISTIAVQTGYSWSEVWDMVHLADSLLVKEADNETTDIPR